MQKFLEIKNLKKLINPRHNFNKRRLRGFTLVELSIVIVIIGIIVIGVTSGQNLVKQYNFIKIITDAEKYKKALITFKTQYNALPGDIKNAYSYWPNEGCTNQNVDINGTGCNGDGSGTIEEQGSSTPLEGLRAWQHLNLAGLLPEKYTGVYNASGKYQIGYNSPGSSFNSMVSMSGTMVKFAAPSTVLADRQPQSSIFSSKDMYSIDKKIDDGIAYKGKFLSQEGYEFRTNTSQNGGTGPCRIIPYLNSGGNTSNYNLNSTIKGCRCFFIF